MLKELFLKKECCPNLRRDFRNQNINIQRSTYYSCCILRFKFRCFYIL